MNNFHKLNPPSPNENEKTPPRKGSSSKEKIDLDSLTSLRASFNSAAELLKSEKPPARKDNEPEVSSTSDMDYRPIGKKVSVCKLVNIYE